MPQQVANFHIALSTFDLAEFDRSLFQSAMTYGQIDGAHEGYSLLSSFNTVTKDAVLGETILEKGKNYTYRIGGAIPFSQAVRDGADASTILPTLNKDYLAKMLMGFNFNYDENREDETEWHYLSEDYVGIGAVKAVGRFPFKRGCVSSADAFFKTLAAEKNDLGKAYNYFLSMSPDAFDYIIALRERTSGDILLMHNQRFSPPALLKHADASVTAHISSNPRVMSEMIKHFRRTDPVTVPLPPHMIHRLKFDDAYRTIERRQLDIGALTIEHNLSGGYVDADLRNARSSVRTATVTKVSTSGGLSVARSGTNQSSRTSSVVRTSARTTSSPGGAQGSYGVVGNSSTRDALAHRCLDKVEGPFYGDKDLSQIPVVAIPVVVADRRDEIRVAYMTPVKDPKEGEAKWSRAASSEKKTKYPLKTQRRPRIITGAPATRNLPSTLVHKPTEPVTTGNDNTSKEDDESLGNAAGSSLFKIGSDRYGTLAQFQDATEQCCATCDSHTYPDVTPEESRDFVFWSDGSGSYICSECASSLDVTSPAEVLSLFPEISRAQQLKQVQEQLQFEAASGYSVTRH